MEHSSEMMGDTMDDALDDDETEGETSDLVNQVCCLIVHSYRTPAFFICAFHEDTGSAVNGPAVLCPPPVVQLALAFLSDPYQLLEVVLSYTVPLHAPDPWIHSCNVALTK